MYVVYRAPRESKDRSLLPKRLDALRCRRIHRSFWRVDEKRVNRVMKVLEKNQPILLRRIREVRRPGFFEDKGIPDLGSLIVVVYGAPKGPNREKVGTLLRSAPCIRLSRSTYAFSQRHSLFDKERKLVDAREFSEFIKEFYENVIVVPRIVLADTNSVEGLVEETRERIEREFSNITARWSELYLKAQSGEDYRVIRDEFSKNRRRLLRAGRVATFYEKWLRLDFSKSLMRSYLARRRIRPFLAKERGTLAGTPRLIHK